MGVIGAGNMSCDESVRDYENHDTGGKAKARKEFVTVDGVRFAVSASSQWKKGAQPLIIWLLLKMCTCEFCMTFFCYFIF